MVEADSHLNLLHVSILDMNKVFEYLEMVSIGIWSQPYTYIPMLLVSDYRVLGHMWSQNDVMNKVFEHMEMMSIGIQ